MEGHFDLVIRGSNLDFEDITANMKLHPTQIKRKGEPITSKHIMKDDYWSYKVKFGDTQLETSLESFLNDLKPSNEYIRSIATKRKVYIFFSLGSNLGQLGFVLKPDILKELADLNISLEVHILSFGEVEDT